MEMDPTGKLARQVVDSRLDVGVFTDVDAVEVQRGIGRQSHVCGMAPVHPHLEHSSPIVDRFTKTFALVPKSWRRLAAKVILLSVEIAQIPDQWLSVRMNHPVQSVKSCQPGLGRLVVEHDRSLLPAWVRSQARDRLTCINGFVTSFRRQWKWAPD